MSIRVAISADPFALNSAQGAGGIANRDEQPTTYSIVLGGKVEPNQHQNRLKLLDRSD